MNSEKNIYWILGGIGAGLVLFAYEFFETSARYASHNVPLSLPVYFLEGGFAILLIPVFIGSFGYFKKYYLLSGTLLGIIAGIVFLSTTTDIAGVVMPSFVILGFIGGLVAQIIHGFVKFLLSRFKK